MTDAQKKEFSDIRANNVRIGTETNEELKSIKEQLQTQAREGVRVDKLAVRKEKYRRYTEAGLTTKYNLDRLKRYAFSLLKQDPEKTVVQPNGCITIKVKVLQQKLILIYFQNCCLNLFELSNHYNLNHHK